MRLVVLRQLDSNKDTTDGEGASPVIRDLNGKDQNGCANQLL
jgi:hypothetical protein